MRILILMFSLVFLSSGSMGCAKVVAKIFKTGGKKAAGEGAEKAAKAAGAGAAVEASETAVRKAPGATDDLVKAADEAVAPGKKVGDEVAGETVVP